MKRSVRLTLYGIGCGLMIVFALTICRAAEDYSHVRIVRLSFVEGTVSLQRPDVSEWAEAPVNTPIQEGFQIATAEGGFAEVEFENASTVRLGQLSLLEFTQLALLPSGGKVNRLTLLEGYGTLSVFPQGDDYYEVKAGDATLVPRGKTRFRVDLDQGFVQVKVFKGTVELQSPEGNGTLGHDTSVVISPGEGQKLQLTQGITKDAWDEWVEQRENVAQAMRNRGAPSAVSAGMSDFFYGFVDLMAYGSWSSYPGYGAIWIPPLNRGWNPYAYGRWCYYPGMGWVWIPAEPWGWVTCHYGNWAYDPIRGWFWVPGGFGVWSGAVVNWHQGPGWIGWTPRPPRRGGPLPPCTHQGCTTVVDIGDFQHGRPVGPRSPANINVAQGRPVDHPDVQPDQTARLPGSPRPRPGFHPAVGNHGEHVGTSGRPAMTVVPAATGRPATSAPGHVQPVTREDSVAPRAVPGAEAARPAILPRTGPDRPAAAPAARGGEMIRPGPHVSYPASKIQENREPQTGSAPQTWTPAGGTGTPRGESQARPTREVDLTPQFGDSRGRDSGASQNFAAPATNSRVPEVRSSGGAGSQPVVRSAPAASPRSESSGRSVDRSVSSGRSSSPSVSAGSSRSSAGSSSSGGSRASSSSSASSSSRSSGGSSGGRSSGGGSSGHSSGGGSSGGHPPKH
jgi:hypothetical protein